MNTRPDDTLAAAAERLEQQRPQPDQAPVSPEPAPTEPAPTDPPAATEPAPAPYPEGDDPLGDRLTAVIRKRRADSEERGGLAATVEALRADVARLAEPDQAPEPEAWKNPYDPTESPLEYQRAEVERLSTVVTSLQRQQAEARQATQGQAAIDQFERGVVYEIEREAQNVPELSEAYGAVSRAFLQSAELQGHRGAAAAQQARLMMLQSYYQQQQRGTDPAMATAQMAQSIGFRPKGGAAMGEGARAKATERGRAAAATSLGGATGTAGASPGPDLQALTRMGRDQLLADGKKNIHRIRDILRGAG